VLGLGPRPPQRPEIPKSLKVFIDPSIDDTDASNDCSWITLIYAPNTTKIEGTCELEKSLRMIGGGGDLGNLL
jgi:hypothetical protein